jgi:hypothetical protein
MKIMIILTIATALVLGLIDGDCTAAVVIAVLFLPDVLNKKRGDEN